MPSFSKNFLFGAVIAILLITTVVFGVFWVQVKREVRIKNPAEGEARQRRQEAVNLQKQIQELQTKLTEQKPQVPETSGWKIYRNETSVKFEIKYPPNWSYSSMSASITPGEFFVCFMDEKYNFEGGECRGGYSLALQNVFYSSEEPNVSRFFRREDLFHEDINQLEIQFSEGGVKFYALCDPTIITMCNQILSTFKFIR